MLVYQVRISHLVAHSSAEMVSSSFRKKLITALLVACLSVVYPRWEEATLEAHWKRLHPKPSKCRLLQTSCTYSISILRVFLSTRVQSEIEVVTE